MKLLLLIMSLLLVLLLAGLWVGSGSYLERWKIEERSAQQEQSNNERKAHIDKIKAELDDASSGKAAIEERARSELGMTGKGETFYEVILQPDHESNTKKATELKKPIINNANNNDNTDNTDKTNNIINND